MTGTAVGYVRLFSCAWQLVSMAEMNRETSVIENRVVGSLGRDTINHKTNKALPIQRKGDHPDFQRSDGSLRTPAGNHVSASASAADYLAILFPCGCWEWGPVASTHRE